MYEDIFTKLGLAKDEAKIYEILLKGGALKASSISARAGLKRGITYKILEELEKKGLATRRENKGSVARFEPSHPLRLKEFAEKEADHLKTASLALQGVLSKLSSDYNLALKKPGVLFYEGKDGIREVLADSLITKTEICSYGDIESIAKYIADINEWYVGRREKLGIKKRGIVLDTPFARKYLADYHRAVTDTRMIRYDAPPFETVMQIYDRKVSYITLSPEHMIGAIIEDPSIYAMHQYLFEYLWPLASPIPRADAISQ